MKFRTNSYDFDNWALCRQECKKKYFDGLNLHYKIYPLDLHLEILNLK